MKTAKKSRKVDNRIANLKTRHAKIEKTMREVRKRPNGENSEQMKRLKKGKLRIKDEITRLQQPVSVTVAA